MHAWRALAFGLAVLTAAQALPAQTKEALLKAGHASSTERPREFLAAVLPFVDR
jgi:hypothetical protein